MRDTKFRAWDELDARMLTGYELADLLMHSYDRGQHVMTLKVGITSRPIYLMQSTGLKDKNGVEIYEGDILSVADRIYTVCWNEGGAFFDLAHVDDTPMDTDYLLSEAIWGWEVVVIGNIYENPELLTEDGDE